MIAGLWHRDTIAWLMVAASLPPAVVALATQGPEALWRMVLCLVVIWTWQGLFLYLRAQPVSPVAIVTAVLIAAMAPGEMAAWQLVLAVSFGTVIGEQVFGGWGRNILNVAVVTLSFLYFAFPETIHPGAGPQMALAALASALILVGFGIASWRVLAGAVIALVGATLLMGAEPALLLQQGSLALGLVFLVADPVASAATRAGRWFHGLLAGGLIALFGFAGTGIDYPQTVVFAALLASLFAPLIDAAVIAAGARRWRRSHG